MAPIPSNNTVPPNTNFAMRTIPPTCGAAMDSCIKSRCDKPIFLFVIVSADMAMVIKPMPPICISNKITLWPNGDQNE